MLKNLYIALVHYPVTNKHGEEVTAAVTNLDIHDISRTAKSYGAKSFAIVTPLVPQQQMVNRVIRHWKFGNGGRWNPNRKDALELVEVFSSLEELACRVREEHDKKPLIIGTSAKLQENSSSYEEIKELILQENRPVIVVFGTGWGLTPECFQAIDFVLLPIKSICTSYNHLSVRAAAAIILDRLLGDREETSGLIENSRKKPASEKTTSL